MKNASILPLLSSFVLFSCIGTQAPAPVTHYGQSEGAGSAGVHTVTRGENLWAISNRYDIVMRDIVISNHLSAPFALRPGQRLELPAPRIHRVRRGDSISTVARLYEVNESELARMNNISAPYIIRPGQKLKLPSVTPKTKPAVIRSASASAPVRTIAPRPSSKPAQQSAAAPVPQVGKGTPVPDQKPAKVQTASASAPSKTLARIPSHTPKRSSSKFLQPVSGKVISTYGPKKDGLYNDGINISAARGTPVKAAENGVVVYAGNALKGSGNLILVRHDNRWMTAYAHLDKITVGRGTVLKRGQAIGTVGSTGSVDSPQLHFEIRRGTDALNPNVYIGS